MCNHLNQDFVPCHSVLFPPLDFPHKLAFNVLQGLLFLSDPDRRKPKVHAKVRDNRNTQYITQVVTRRCGNICSKMGAELMKVYLLAQSLTVGVEDFGDVPGILGGSL